VALDDGGTVPGFVAQHLDEHAPGVIDITAFGGWRAYLDSR
jgi:hypothetical protein